MAALEAFAADRGRRTVRPTDLCAYTLKHSSDLEAYLPVMFAVDDIDDTLERLGKRGAQLVSEVVQYKNVYGLCSSAGLKSFSSPKLSAIRRQRLSAFNFRARSRGEWRLSLLKTKKVEEYGVVPVNKMPRNAGHFLLLVRLLELPD
jgi:hypothetical protein